MTYDEQRLLQRVLDILNHPDCTKINPNDLLAVLKVLISQAIEDSYE
jgi:hypothetical protein